jgi:hypothetical protein
MKDHRSGFMRSRVLRALVVVAPLLVGLGRVPLEAPGHSTGKTTATVAAKRYTSVRSVVVEPSS